MSDEQAFESLRRRYGMSPRPGETPVMMVERVLAERFGIFPKVWEENGQLVAGYTRDQFEEER